MLVAEQRAAAVTLLSQLLCLRRCLCLTSCCQAPSCGALWGSIRGIKASCLCSLSHQRAERKRVRLPSHLCLGLQQVLWLQR